VAVRWRCVGADGGEGAVIAFTLKKAKEKAAIAADTTYLGLDLVKSRLAHPFSSMLLKE